MVIATSVQAQDAVPAKRPTAPMPRYVWDIVCMAADNHWKINGGQKLTAADEQASIRLIKAAEESGKPLGKTMQNVGDDMMPHFAAYLNNPRAYFKLTAGEMRTHCLTVLGK